MKRRLGPIILLLAVFSTAHAGESLSEKVRLLEELLQQRPSSWEVAEVAAAGEPFLRPKSISLPYSWRHSRPLVFRADIEIPAAVLERPVAGGKVWLQMEGYGQGEVFVNGERQRQFRQTPGTVILAENAVPKAVYRIELSFKGRRGRPAEFRSAIVRYATLETLDQRASQFRKTVDSLLRIIGTEKHASFGPPLERAARALDLQSLGRGRWEEFLESLDASLAALRPLSPFIKSHALHLLAYSHMDPAWLWDRAEGEHIVWKQTSEYALDMLKTYPQLVYAASQMHGYRWMERDYPDLFAKIRSAIKSGRWEAVGGQWVESDANLPSGESLVRQFLYGRKYARDKLGVESSVAWMPDTFGFPSGLPQILAKCDIRGLLIYRLSRNDTTPFPHNVFWWRGPDESRLLTYLLPGPYNDTLVQEDLASRLAKVKTKHGLKHNLVAFGRGDHGGGVPPDYMERALALRKDPLFPEIRFTSAEKYFELLSRSERNVPYPEWQDELYLESFRGTYTTQAAIKHLNRRNEHLMVNAEKLASLAALATGRDYDASKIEESWTTLLFNQFHDILPGTAIGPVYRDAQSDHALIAADMGGVVQSGLAALAGRADTSGEGLPLLLFNGLSWRRDDVVERPRPEGWESAAVHDESGQEIASQLIQGGDGRPTLLFVARNVPAMGFVVYRMIGNAQRASTSSKPFIGRSPNVLENEFFRVEVDLGTGWIRSILDKRASREVVAKGRYAFELQAYKENPDSSAWAPVFPPSKSGIVPPPESLMPMPPTAKVELVENGPVRAVIRAERRFGEKTVLRSSYWLVQGVPQVFGRLDVDWQETHVFLKSAFGVALDADRVTYEAPYAVTTRTTRPRTPSERAKWEVPGHRWADMTDKRDAYGLTLLSFDKYGYDARENVFRLSLLRATTRPDARADRGLHRIDYALFPHAGNWREAGSARRAAEYNDPVWAVSSEPHPGPFGRRRSFASLDNPQVSLTALKRSEDGQGWVFRLVETWGKGTSALVRFPLEPKRIYETNLVERILKEIPAPDGNTLKVPCRPFEIKTLKVIF